MATVSVTITIPEDLRDRVDATARSARVTRSWLVTTIMSGWLDELDAKAACGEVRMEATNRAIAAALDGPA
jgi:hypothetical protein